MCARLVKDLTDAALAQITNLADFPKRKFFITIESYDGTLPFRKRLNGCLEFFHKILGLNQRERGAKRRMRVLFKPVLLRFGVDRKTFETKRQSVVQFSVDPVVGLQWNLQLLGHLFGIRFAEKLSNQTNSRRFNLTSPDTPRATHRVQRAQTLHDFPVDTVPRVNIEFDAPSRIVALQSF